MQSFTKYTKFGVSYLSSHPTPITHYICVVLGEFCKFTEPPFCHSLVNNNDNLSLKHDVKIINVIHLKPKACYSRGILQMVVMSISTDIKSAKVTAETVRILIPLMVCCTIFNFVNQ